MANTSTNQKWFFQRESFKILLLIIFTLLAYSGVIKNGFTDWDDNLYVTDLELIRSLSWENIQAIFSTLVASLYTPLAVLSFAVEYHFFSLNPSAFHSTNLILHVIAVILVYFLVKNWSDEECVALSVAIIFAVHPLNSEAVSWISSRKDLLFSVFYLAGLIAYYKYLRSSKGIKNWFPVFFLFVLSILSKPTALTFPFVLLLIDYFEFKKINLKSIWEKLPLIVVSLGYFIFGVILLEEIDVFEGAPEGYTLIDKVFLAAYSFSFYIYSTLIPFSLSNFHSYPHLIDGKLDLIYYLSPLFLVALGIFLYKVWNVKRMVVFAFLFFAFILGPTLRFIPTGYPIVADRYYYLASVGIIFVLVWLLNFIGKKIGFNVGLKFLFLVFPLSIIFIFISRDRVKDWKNSITLWESALEDDPSLHLAFTHLAEGYENFGNKEKALYFYENTLKENPNLPEILNSAAVIYFENNVHKKALEYYNRAIKIDKSSELPYYNRGNLFKANKKWKQSISDYDKAINLKSNFAEAYNNRGISKIMLGDSLGAYQDFEKAVELDPENKMFNQNLQRLQATYKP